MTERSIPLTVIGGYLGSGKTTLLNRLLGRAGGRRLGLIVNDFGELGVDAGRLGGDGLVNLPNGCVCCTLGNDLRTALLAMSGADPCPDHIVIEASGVAEPRSVAAWSSVPPFAPGGVVVVAAADSVQRMARDRYVGGEVRRQVEGADLVVLSKTDLVDEGQAAEAAAWCTEVSGGAPVVPAVHGAVPAEVVLGATVTRGAPVEVEHDAHEHGYGRWSWVAEEPVPAEALDRFLARLPANLLRLKGEVRLVSGATVAVDVVGRAVDRRAAPPASTSRLEAIGIGSSLHIEPPAG